MRFSINEFNCIDTGTEIIMTLKVSRAYSKMIDSFKALFKPADYELKQIRKKRSLNANSFCWKLCTEIANATAQTKEYVYRDAISHVGVYEALLFKDDDAMTRFKQKWMTNGEGWLTRTIDKDKHILFAYYGSSSYNTKEMSILIDFLNNEAHELGIYLLTEADIDLLKQEWNNGR